MTAPGQQPPQGPQQPPQPPPPGAFDPNDPAYKQATQQNFWDNFNPLGGIERVIQYDAQYTANSGSGKFSIDPAEIEPLKQQWQHCIDRLKDAIAHAQHLVSIKGPGNEDASNNMANGANESGRAYIEHNKQLVKYCQAEMDKLDAALKAYQQNEDHNTHHVSRHGRS